MSEKSNQSSPQLPSTNNSTQSSPQITTQQTLSNVNQSSTTPITQSPNIQPQPAQPSQQTIPVTTQPPVNAQIPPQVQQNPANSNAAGAASSMTLLDNLTSQLTADRKERFIELFRQLQTNNVTANQFLAQARMLLNQRQYQQLENLKAKPAQQPKTTPVRPPIQPQQYNINQPISSSQVRDQDAQRSMSGLIAPQSKRTRAMDTSNSQSPLYKSNATPSAQIQQPQQQISPQQIQPQVQPLQPQQNVISQQPQPDTSAKVDNNDNLQTISQDILNLEMLTRRIKRLVAPMNLEVGQDVETLIALSLEKRLQRLLHSMISASKYRVDSQSFTQPPINETGHHPFKIVDIHDIKKQLLAIERVEREEERKRKELILERERKSQMGEDGGEGGDGDRPSKKKKKKDTGPGVTARYMSDDVRNKTTNETALLIAGGVKKSWMYATTPTKEKAPPIARQNSNAAHDPSFMSPNVTSPLSTSPTNTAFSSFDANDDQPRGRGRPRRRKSGSGPDILQGKKPKAFTRGPSDAGLFLPPSTIGRPHRLGEQSMRKITIRDALFVLEDEYENKTECARRALLKAYLK